MLSRFAQSLVRASRGKPVVTTLLILLLTIGSAVGAVKTLGMNTDSLALFDSGLDFREAEKVYDAQFPGEVDLIVAVIDGPSAAEAQRAGPSQSVLHKAPTDGPSPRGLTDHQIVDFDIVARAGRQAWAGAG